MSKSGDHGNKPNTTELGLEGGDDLATQRSRVGRPLIGTLKFIAWKAKIFLHVLHSCVSRPQQQCLKYKIMAHVTLLLRDAQPHETWYTYMYLGVCGRQEHVKSPFPSTSLLLNCP